MHPSIWKSLLMKEEISAKKKKYDAEQGDESISQKMYNPRRELRAWCLWGSAGDRWPGGLLLLYGLESNPESSLQTPQEA